MTIIPEFNPSREPSARIRAVLRDHMADTRGLRTAYKKLAAMRPDFRESMYLDLLAREQARDTPRRTFVHGLYTRYAEVRRERELSSLMAQFDG